MFFLKVNVFNLAKNSKGFISLILSKLEEFYLMYILVQINYCFDLDFYYLNGLREKEIEFDFYFVLFPEGAPNLGSPLSQPSFAPSFECKRF